MAVRFDLPLFTLLAPGSNDFFKMRYNDRNWLIMFTSEENANLYLGRGAGPARVARIATRSAMCGLLHSVQKDGAAFTDYDLVIDPLFSNEDSEYQVMTRAVFLISVLDN